MSGSEKDERKPDPAFENPQLTRLRTLTKVCSSSVTPSCPSTKRDGAFRNRSLDPKLHGQNGKREVLQYENLKNIHL